MSLASLLSFLCENVFETVIAVVLFFINKHEHRNTVSTDNDPVEEVKEANEDTIYVNHIYLPKNYEIDNINESNIFKKEYLINGYSFSEESFVNRNIFKEFQIIEDDNKFYLENLNRNSLMDESIDDSIDDDFIECVEDEFPGTSLDVSIQETQYGLIINSTVLVPENNWHSIVKEQNRTRCIVCDITVGKPTDHIKLKTHKRSLDKYKPLKKYDSSLTRRIRNDYHCIICNAIFKFSNIKKHFDSKHHEENMLYSTNRAVDVLEVNLKSDRDIDFTDSDVNSKAIDTQDENVSSNDERNVCPEENSYSSVQEPDNFNDKKREVIKLTEESRNMILIPNTSKFYCMACTCSYDLAHKSNHYSDEYHLKKLSECTVIEKYRQFFVRKVGEKYYHCGICNSLQYPYNIDTHMELVHHVIVSKTDQDEPLGYINNENQRNISGQTRNMYNENMNNESNESRSSSSIHLHESNENRSSSSINYDESNENRSSSSIHYREPNENQMIFRPDNRSSPSILCNEYIYLNQFQQILRVSYMSYHFVIKRVNDYVCWLCNFSSTEFKMILHTNEQGHMGTIIYINFLQDFGLNLIRIINPVAHCAICNTYFYVSAIHGHIQHPLHIRLLTAAIIKSPNYMNNVPNQTHYNQLAFGLPSMNHINVNESNANQTNANINELSVNQNCLDVNETRLSLTDTNLKESDNIFTNNDANESSVNLTNTYVNETSENLIHTSNGSSANLTKTDINSSCKSLTNPELNESGDNLTKNDWNESSSNLTNNYEKESSKSQTDPELNESGKNLTNSHANESSSNLTANYEKESSENLTDPVLNESGKNRTKSDANESSSNLTDNYEKDSSENVTDPELNESGNNLINNNTNELTSNLTYNYEKKSSQNLTDAEFNESGENLTGSVWNDLGENLTNNESNESNSNLTNDSEKESSENLTDPELNESDETLTNNDANESSSNLTYNYEKESSENPVDTEFNESCENLIDIELNESGENLTDTVWNDSGENLANNNANESSASLTNNYENLTDPELNKSGKNLTNNNVNESSPNETNTDMKDSSKSLIHTDLNVSIDKESDINIINNVVIESSANVTNHELNESSANQTNTDDHESYKNPKSTDMKESGDNQTKIEPYNFDCIYLKLKDTYVKVSYKSYNGLVFVGDGSHYCFLCSLRVYDSYQEHIEDENHLIHLKNSYFIDKNIKHLLRQSPTAYHCVNCNILFIKRELELHMKWSGLQLKCDKKTRKSDFKLGIKYVNIKTTQESNVLDVPSEMNIIIKIDVRNSGGDVEVIKSDKIVVFDGNGVQISWDSWHGLTKNKKGYHCALCQINLKEGDVNMHIAEEKHANILQNTIEKKFLPSIIRTINESNMHCLTCNVAVLNRNNVFSEHLKGKKHDRNLFVIKQIDLNNVCTRDIVYA